MYGLVIGKNFTVAEKILKSIILHYEQNHVFTSFIRKDQVRFENNQLWVAVGESHPAKIRGYKPKVIYLDSRVKDAEILNNIQYLKMTIPNLKIVVW
ncbi:MAG: hypothetical protein E7167_02010 [Firmicutes bacterium]|nr:hypothetical protein [Bacillota bacterium]